MFPLSSCQSRIDSFSSRWYSVWASPLSSYQTVTVSPYRVILCGLLHRISDSANQYRPQCVICWPDPFFRFQVISCAIVSFSRVFKTDCQECAGPPSGENSGIRISSLGSAIAGTRVLDRRQTPNNRVWLSPLRTTQEPIRHRGQTSNRAGHR